MSRLGLVAALLFAGPLAAQVRVPGAVPLVAPEAFTGWLAEVEHCTGTPATGRVTWRTVPGALFNFTRDGIGERAFGLWVPPDTIYLAQSWLVREWAVKHELLHYVLQNEQHPPIFAACGGNL